MRAVAAALVMYFVAAQCSFSEEDRTADLRVRHESGVTGIESDV
jgi:hypothetical protein